MGFITLKSEYNEPKWALEIGGKMRRRFILIVVLVLALSGLAGCGNDSNNSNSSNSGNSNAGNSSNGYWKDGLIDRTDYRNYFVIVDGKKYDLDTTLQEILDDGYEVRAGLDISREMKPNTFELVFLSRDGERVFKVLPANRTDKPLPLSQCTIQEFEVMTEWYPNASIVAGLSLGDSRDSVIATFGPLLNPEQEVFIFYGSGTSNAGIFSFHFDESGAMISARVAFNKK